MPLLALDCSLVLSLVTTSLHVGSPTSYTLPGSEPEPLAALLVVLAGLSSPADCLVEDSAFITAQGGCLDLATGLVWGRSSLTFEGPPTTPYGATTWSNAMAYCDGLADGGFGDWFLPTRTQMLEVVSHGSATHLNLGTTTSNYVWWSSTTKGSQRAWVVDLWGGGNYDTLKSGINPYTCVRWASTAVAPAAPSGLVATLVGTNQVNLTWNDNSTDETAFHVDRSVDGTTWTTIATMPANSTSYGEGNLAPGQQYNYRTWASNSGGSSGFSNVTGVTTSAGVSLAHQEVSVEGTVSGTFSDTWYDDGVRQSITEIHTGGPPSQRRSRLEHKWGFTVATGSTVTLHVKAHRTDSGEGDVFYLAYSYTDAGSGSYTTLPGAITATEAGGEHSTFALPPMNAGSLWIRVMDSNRDPGFGALDTLYVDQLYITSL